MKRKKKKRQHASVNLTMKFGKFIQGMKMFCDTNFDTYSLWEAGWKERYYKAKFNLTLMDRDEIRQ